MISRFIFIVLLISSISLSGQSLVKKIDFNDTYTKDYVIKQFSGVQYDSIAYFKFIIHENREDMKYVLELSMNGIDFIEIKEKEGFKSPNQEALMYCFKLNNHLAANFFRIRMQHGEDSDYSHVVKLPNTNILNNADNIYLAKNNFNE